MLEGFEVYNYSIGTASITLSDNGVAFSKTAVIKMNKCEYAKLLINFTEKKIAIIKSKQDEEGSIAFFNPDKKLVSVRWNNKELQKTLANIMGWELKEGIAYKIDGTYSYEDEAIIFDLNQGELITTK